MRFSAQDASSSKLIAASVSSLISADTQDINFDFGGKFTGFCVAITFVSVFWYFQVTSSMENK